jgi:hypothetical protein
VAGYGRHAAESCFVKSDIPRLTDRDVQTALRLLAGHTTNGIAYQIHQGHRHPLGHDFKELGIGRRSTHSIKGKVVAASRLGEERKMERAMGIEPTRAALPELEKPGVSRRAYTQV